MVVRVRLQSLRQLLFAVGADLLVVLGIGGVLVWAWDLSDGALYQYAQGIQFAQDFRERAAGAQTPAVPQVRPTPAISTLLPARLARRDPRLIGRLEIPSIQLSVMMREGVDSASLRKAAGHLPSSALPGDSGNFVLLGHRDTFFRPLRGITQGDTIRVWSQREMFTYRVDSIWIESPDLAWALQDTSASMLTLITCFPFDYVGPAPRRFVVQARMIAAEMGRSVRK